MNYVDAVVVELLGEPAPATEEWAKGMWTVKYVEDCYGRKRETEKYFTSEQEALNFKVGTKYLT